MKKFLFSFLIIFTVLSIQCKIRHDNIIKILIPKYPLTFNPQLATEMLSSDILYPLYNSLFTYDKNGKLNPDIIKEFHWIDNKTFSFTIKKGLRFSNGEPLDNNTVIENINYFRDKERDFPYSAQFDFIKKIEKDKNSIKIYLKYPFAPLLSYLTFKIIPPEFLGKNQIIPSSTGFSIIKRNKGFSYLYKNRIYDFNICPDEITAVLKLLNGEADIIYGYKVNNKKLDKTKIKEKNYILNSLYYIVFNMRQPKFSNFENRCFIKNIIDFKDFYKILGNNYHYSFYSILNPDFKSSIDYPLMNKKCRGNLNSVSLLVNSESELRKKYAQIIKEQFEKYNIKTKIISFEYGIYLERLKKGDFDIALGAYVFDSDPDQRDIWQTKGTMNYSGLSDKNIDIMLNKGIKIIDYSERIGFYQSVYKKIMEKIPIVFLPTPLYSIYYGKGVFIELPSLVHSNSSALCYLKKWHK